VFLNSDLGLMGNEVLFLADEGWLPALVPLLLGARFMPDLEGYVQPIHQES
jgi:hypothetical protein